MDNNELVGLRNNILLLSNELAEVKKRQVSEARIQKMIKSEVERQVNHYIKGFNQLLKEGRRMYKTIKGAE